MAFQGILRDFREFQGFLRAFIGFHYISLRGISCILWISWDLILLGGISAFQGFSGYSS